MLLKSSKAFTLIEVVVVIVILSIVSAIAITFTRNNATGQDVAAESITFQLTGSTLEKVKASPSVTSSLASNVSTFTVTRGAAGNDEITLVLTLTLTSGENMTLQTKVYPKNLPKDATYKNFCQNWIEEISP